MNKIIKNKMVIGGTILLLAATPVLAGETGGDDQGAFYRANELSVDGFGTASLGRYSLEHFSGQRVKHNARLGAGAGVNYFFTEHIGLGLDGYSENTSGAFIDSASANLIFRLPLGQSPVAPYAFVGGGHNFDNVRTTFAQAGAGVECRFNRHVGVFIDGRAVVPDRTKYYGVGRLGLRFAL